MRGRTVDPTPEVTVVRRRPRHLRRLLLVLAAAVPVGAVGVSTVAFSWTNPLTVTGGQPQSSAGDFGALGSGGAAVPPGQSAPPAGWSVERTNRAGVPLIATRLLHPEPNDQRAFVGAAWLSASGLRFTLVPGTAQPGGRWQTDGAVPAGDRAMLAAVFNSGFKLTDIDGGFRAQGRTARPMRVGEATLALTADGHARVGAWGSDIVDRPEIVAARQNLHLIVAGGRTEPGLLTRHDGTWSTARHQVQRTPRSGIGQLADGSLVYLAGPDLDLQQLADAFTSIHAVTAMQLDIHPNMEVFHLFQRGQRATPGPARSLLSVLAAPMHRYLVPDRRDFVIAVERSMVGPS